MIFIQGECGSGKTAFMKHLISELKTIQPFDQYYELNKHKLPVFASMINAESRMHFLNAWRSVFQMLVKFFCKKRGQTNKHRFIANFIIREEACELGDIICDITGVDYVQMKKSQRETIKQHAQVKPEYNKFEFVNTVKYSEAAVDKMCNFFSNLFKFMCGDQSEVESDWGGGGEGDGSAKSIKKKKTKKKSNSGKGFADSSSDEESNAANLDDPIMVVIDNAHLMDATSWKLLSEIGQEEFRVSFFLIIKSDYRDRLVIEGDSKKAFDDAWETLFSAGLPI